jgi:hypothetical protein
MNVSKEFQISKFINIHLVGLVLFHVGRHRDGWINTMRLMVAFCIYFANMHKRVL